ncbi:MAG: N-acetyltransferase family protein [Candidatus Nanohalobium sp.]
MCACYLRHLKISQPPGCRSWYSTHRKASQTKHQRSGDPDWCLTEEAASWYRERINQGNGFAEVVEDDGQVIGYAIGVAESAEEFRTTNTLAELETMYLQPEYRGQGIGTQIINSSKTGPKKKTQTG